jgi:chemotaxis protein CheC
VRLDLLTEMQLSALRETGSIGAGHAATALSQLVGHCVTIDVPTLEIIEIGEVPAVFGGPETLVGAVYTRLLGDLAGSRVTGARRPAAKPSRRLGEVVRR